jgi:hypothetical protein
MEEPERVKSGADLNTACIRPGGFDTLSDSERKPPDRFPGFERNSRISLCANRLAQIFDAAVSFSAERPRSHRRAPQRLKGRPVEYS